MSSTYAASSSQKTCFLSFAESADAFVQLPRGHGASTANRPVEQPNAVALHEGVLVRPYVMPVVRGQVVRVVLEVGRQEADLWKSFERVEHALHPIPRELHDVVVEFDEVRSRRQPEGSGVAVLPDVLLAPNHADARIVERLQVLGASRLATRCPR